MQSKKSEHFILYDALEENIPEEEEFLSWPITKIHTDGFTLGEAVDEDGPTDESKNHWAMIFETSMGSVRVSMESRANIRTGKRGVLAVHTLSYSGRSWSSVHRETFMWQKSSTTIRDALVFIFSRGWHRKTMINGLRGYGYIGEISCSGKRVADFLPFVYTRDDDNWNLVTKRARPIELGQFLL